MSREVSSDVLAAIQDAASVRMVVKAVVDPSRTFFNSLSDDYPYDAGDYDTPTDTPTGQAVCYDANTSNVYTFVVDPSTGAIYGMVKGSATKNNLSLTADENTKPAVQPLGNGSAYLYYWDGSNLKRVTVNLSTWGTSGSTTVTIDYTPSAWTISGGSPHVLGGGQLGFTYQTSLGGIACAYYDNERWYHWSGRFISPNQKTAIDWSIYSACVVKDGKVFFYCTDMDTGEVKGVEFTPGVSWSDSFVALPADLSRFNIGNAIQANGYIHLSGQFHRTGDLADAEVYSLVLRSSNGRTFSWDRFTLLSTLGFTFHIGADNTNKVLWASDRNSVGNANMSCFFTNNPVDRVILQPPSDVVAFSLTQSDSASLRIMAGDPVYVNNDVVKKGSRVTVYIGYETGSGYTYTRYAQYIINDDRVEAREGERLFFLQLMDEGLWKTNEIAFPFYAEILSKVSSHDDCDERDKMYPVQTKRPDAPDFLYIDFWGNNYWSGDGTVTTGVDWRFRADGNGCERSSFTNYQGTTDQLRMKTIDLNEHPLLTDYPTLSSTSIGVSFYGWEMVTTATRPNSTWKIYAVTAPTDDLEDKTVTQGTLTSSYSKTPQDYYSSEAGSYPITWNVTGLTAGHALLYFGFAIENTDASQGSSTAAPERLEVTGLEFVYTTDSSSKGWALSYPSGETREYLEMPKTGVPSVMFLSKPYTAFNFTVAAEFIYTAGDEPLMYGKVGWGVVGLGEDGKNLVLARYNVLTSYVEVVFLRDGVETRVATYTPSAVPEDILMDHRDGVFRIYIRESGTAWTGPVITYYWDEVSNDVISTSETGIMHVGIYGAAIPPSFICPGFNVLNGQGIAVGSFQDPSTVLNGFPSTGKVVIDGIQYSYTSKVTGSVLYGPYQGRQSESYVGYSESGVTYEAAWGTEIALYMPDNAYNYATGYLFATDNGHTWVIDKSDWTVTHYTAGVPNYLRNRSRHYCTDHGGNVVGLNNRCYISPGLLDITQEDDNDSYLHGFGSLVALYGTDKIWVKRVVASMLDTEATVKDMISYICGVASIEPEFNGDWTLESQVVGTTPVQLAANTELLPGGYDVTFTVPALSSTHWVEVYASNLFLNTTETIHLGIKNTSNLLEIYSDPSGSTASESIRTEISATQSRVVRVLFHNEFASVFIDGKPMATFAYGEENLAWPSTQVNLYLKSSTNSYTISGIRLVELFDWREAVYMESEITASSALGSVIQERPIEMLTNQSGGLSFSYNIVRDTISTSIGTARIHMHSYSRKTSKDAGSDAIVYYRDIAFVSDSVFAEEEGFLTRVLKLASLDSGASTAARLILRKSRERSKPHSLRIRPDIRIVPGDRYEFAYRTIDGETISKAIIIESIGLEMMEGEYVMPLSGREDTTQIKVGVVSAYLEGTT